jgi:hypothetical protein
MLPKIPNSIFEMYNEIKIHILPGLEFIKLFFPLLPEISGFSLVSEHFVTVFDQSNICP